MHDHQGHSHNHADGASEKRLAIAAGLTGVFMIAELVGGVISGSLALIADAGHMLIDFASLGFAWAAFRITRRPADQRQTYGYDRLQVLVAFVNGLILFPVAAWIIWEAVERLREPSPVLGGLMLWVATGGLIVNIVAFLVLNGGEKENVNIRGAVLHVLGDLLGSVGAIVAAIVILMTGWTPIDPLLSVFVSVIILGGAWRLVRDSGHILLEAAPSNLDTHEIGPALVAGVAGVIGVHHVHAWSITERRRMITLHACLAEGTDGLTAMRDIKAMLADKFNLTHATVEIEYGECSETDPECGHAKPDDAHGHAHDHAHDHEDHAGHTHSHRLIAGTT